MWGALLRPILAILSIAIGLLPIGGCRPGAPTPVEPDADAPAARLDVQGHRGDRGNVPPGNTIASYESALALGRSGIDTIEADMQITGDRQVVMGHDDDLRETPCAWAGPGEAPSSLISEQSAAEVASWDCHPELDGIQAPPPLADALDLDRRVAFNLEFKRTSESDVDIYMQALIAYQRACDGCLDGRLTLQSFEWSALRHARASYADTLGFRAAILDKRGDFAEISAARAYAQIWSPTHELVSPELVARVHAIDMQVIPWTVNTQAQMQSLIDMGVDGIITDYPDVLLGLLGRGGSGAAVVADPTISVAPPPPCPADMVFIPGGEYTMNGAHDIDPHVTVFDLCLDRTEVTHGAYLACVDAGDCRVPLGYGQFTQCNYQSPDQSPDGVPELPMDCVDWFEASDYCSVLGKRLPTQQEWEWAARGRDAGYEYPWGNEPPSASRLNSRDTVCGEDLPLYEGSDGYCALAPVGSYPDGASRDGVLDMAGNAEEWTASAWDPTGLYADPEDFVTRGGNAHYNTLRGVSVGLVSRTDRSSKLAMLGFRCASEPKPAQGPR